MPTQEKLEKLTDMYSRDADISAFAWHEEGCIVGIIVLRALGAGCFEIISIAVNAPRQRAGIGRALVEGAKRTLDCVSLFAETDDDAVEFYRKAAFAVTSLGEKYPGIVRYACLLEASVNE
jgi:ribosomal protein S18 acetylase RimI-like enzyme